MSVMYIRNEQTGKFEPVPSLVGPQGLKGDTGITPNLQVGTVTTGNPGTSAEVTITGTPEEPVLNFKIPKGEPGNIGDLTINGKHPDETGSMTLNASDISYGNKTVADELGRSIAIQLDGEGNGTIVYS